MDSTEDCFIQVGGFGSLQVSWGGLYRILFYAGLLGGAVFRYIVVDCTEDCFIQFGGREFSSDIMRWNALKTVLYRLLRWSSLHV